MGSSNIRDLLTSFSPSLDFFAISSGDGRIKIWDTVKGQIQTEFADIVSTGGTNLFGKPEKGHLSVDYSCMKWLSLDKKKKRKLGSSLLVLGTGCGDVLALDISAGQLKWKVNDCHPGAGADGIVCKLDSMTGNLLGKFRASAKAISSMSVSSDGKILATAAAQLKVFNCSDHTKIQKFSGHPGSVRCMVFTNDGKYILSSAISERYVALWKLDGGKKQSACCVLAMDHPAVFLDSRCVDAADVDASGLYVLAISEMGICYFWYGKNIEELRNAKSTKLSLSLDDQFSKRQKIPTIFAAKLQGTAKLASAHIFLAYGLVIKPSFEKVIVHSGSDVKLNSSTVGSFYPSVSLANLKKGQFHITKCFLCCLACVSQVGSRIQMLVEVIGYLPNQNTNQWLRCVEVIVSALDRANAEDAILPIPKVLDFHHQKKKHQNSSIVTAEVMTDDVANSKRVAQAKEEKAFICYEAWSHGHIKPNEMEEAGHRPICMEDRLRTLGILDNKDDLTSDSVFDSMKLRGINIEANNMPQKKMRAAILSMVPSDAYKLLEVLISRWQSRSHSGKYVLPWICCILVNHGDYVISQEPVTQLLDSLHKLTKSKSTAIQSLLQLSGRLQLITAQIDKAVQNEGQTYLDDHDRLPARPRSVAEQMKPAQAAEGGPSEDGTKGSNLPHQEGRNRKLRRSHVSLDNRSDRKSVASSKRRVSPSRTLSNVNLSARPSMPRETEKADLRDKLNN
ncbi:transducin family protein [Actinidia rufa]|uniref:Transducin family protein n=1 Tax=Actinidia rufa TaxID=165716 RepID=A0A7J0GE59_9ERIC|nr:transducin family protein [Actinidia rufa]